MVQGKGPRALVLRSLSFSVAALCAAGCSGNEPMPNDPDGGSTAACVTKDMPSFELGTGVDRFEPLADGQEMRMAMGPQGGCHLWLAVRTDGFAQRRFQIAYDILFAATGVSSGSASSQRVPLQPRADAPGLCEYTGFTAFLIEASKLKDQRLKIEVTVKDDLGRTASASREVVARWPEPVEGRDPSSLCGG